MSPLASQLRGVLPKSCPYDREAIHEAIVKGTQGWHQRYKEANTPSQWALCEHRSTVSSGPPTDAASSIARISRDGESQILSITFDAGTSMQTRWSTLADVTRKLNDGANTVTTAMYDINESRRRFGDPAQASILSVSDDEIQTVETSRAQSL